jgi:hypothetical protein
MEKLTKVDLEYLITADVRSAKNPHLATDICRGLSLGLLSEGLRRLGRWARQWRIGNLSILFVVLDRDDLQFAREHEQFASRLRSLQK